MVKKKIDTDAEKGQVEEDKVVKSLIDSIEEEELTGEKFKRWEADEARSALFEQEEKRPLLSVIGLVIGLLSWIIIFIPVGKELIVKQIFLMLAISAGAFVLSFFGRRQAYYMSVIGMLVSGGLMLFLLIALIVHYVTK